jgi:hypothetical protein
MSKSRVVMTIPAPISHLLSLGLLLTAARGSAATPNTLRGIASPAISPLVISTSSEMCFLSPAPSVNTHFRSDCGLQFPGLAATGEVSLS